MRIILEVVAGPHVKQRFTLAGHQKATFGRTEWADFQLPEDLHMSGKHFSVEGDGRACLVRDLDSTNGTYVNEVRVVERVVVTGDVIRTGHSRIQVTLEHVPSPAAAADSGPALPPAETPRATPEPPTAPPQHQPTLMSLSQIRAGIASRVYQDALASDDPLVRRSAMLAAAWKRQAWVLPYLRSQSSPVLADHWDALWLLAVLGEPVDLGRIVAIGGTADLGPRRFRILGTFGHPQVVNDLLIGIENTNPAVAVVAGAAFTKITGVDVSSYGGAAVARQMNPPSESQPNEPDAGPLPSPEIAARQWRNLKSRFAPGQRWCRGIEVSGGLPLEAVKRVDLESRFEACLRGRFAGTWQATRFDLEQLADCLELTAD